MVKLLLEFGTRTDIKSHSWKDTPAQRAMAFKHPGVAARINGTKK